MALGLCASLVPMEKNALCTNLIKGPVDKKRHLLLSLLCEGMIRRRLVMTLRRVLTCGPP